MISSCFRILLLFVLASPTLGATWEFERRDLRPIRPSALEVTMSGPIERGDAARLAILLERESGPEVRDILFIMNSPGGNLAEGIAIGRVIASRSETTSAQVGSEDRPYAFCASACVLAYLGADYRYLSRDGRIGVHRFSAPDARMNGAEGMATAQENLGDDHRVHPGATRQPRTVRAHVSHWRLGYRLGRKVDTRGVAGRHRARL